MKNVLLFIRIAAILAIGLVATVGIFGEPNEEQPFGSWLFDLIVSKAIGFAAILGIMFLWGGADCVKKFVKGIFKNEFEPKHANN